MDDAKILNREIDAGVIDWVKLGSGVSKKSNQPYYFLITHFCNGYENRTFLSNESLFCVKDAVFKYENAE